MKENLRRGIWISVRMIAICLFAAFCGNACAEMPYIETDAAGTSIAGEAQIVSEDHALYTYEEMAEDLEQLQELYPNLLQVRELGVSHDGRTLFDAMLGDEGAEKHVLIQASIHAREYMNTLVAMRQLETVLRSYETAAYHGIPIRELFSGYCFHILPMANPDGVTISQFGPEEIRSAELREELEACREADGGTEQNYWKNWKANARGVDLNRNFDSCWETYRGMSRPSAEHYKGEAPASEPETRAILSVAEEYPLICTVSYHSTGNAVYWDYGSRGDIFQADRRLANAVSAQTGYPMVSAAESALDAAGCSDYFILEMKIPSVTIENGAANCPLPVEEFASLWRANQNLWPALAELYLSEPKPRVYTGMTTEYVTGRIYAAGVNEFLTLRDAPSTSGAALRRLPVDAMMELLEFVNNEFCKVRVCDTGEVGYVMIKYLY